VCFVGELGAILILQQSSDAPLQGLLQKRADKEIRYPARSRGKGESVSRNITGPAKDKRPPDGRIYEGGGQNSLKRQMELRTTRPMKGAARKRRGKGRFIESPDRNWWSNNGGALAADRGGGSCCSLTKEEQGGARRKSRWTSTRITIA